MKKAFIISKVPAATLALTSTLTPLGWRVMKIEPSALALQRIDNGDCLFVCHNEITTETFDTVNAALSRDILHLIICLQEVHPEWESKLRELGIDGIVRHPFTSAQLLQRLNHSLRHNPAPAPVAQTKSPVTEASSNSITREIGRLLRLSHSASSEDFVSQYLHTLKDTFSLTRIGYYAFNNADALKPEYVEGIGSSTAQHINLLPTEGLGLHMLTRSTAVRCSDCTDANMLSELQTLGVDVALPVVCPEQVLGLAVFGPHILGDELSKQEIMQLYPLLEDFGLSLWQMRRNQSTREHSKLQASLLEQDSHGLLAVDSKLNVLYHNPALLTLFHIQSPAALIQELPVTVVGYLYSVGREGAEPFNTQVTINGRTLDLTLYRQGDTLILRCTDVTEAKKLQVQMITRSQQDIFRLLSMQISHRLNNILNPLAAFDSVDTADTSSLSTHLHSLASVNAQAQHLQQQLQAISQEQPITAITSAQLLQQVSQELVRLGHPISLDGGDNIPLFTQVEQLKVCLTALARNALQVGSKGFSVGIVREPSHITFKVTDGGSGMPAGLWESICNHSLPSQAIGLGLTVTSLLAARNAWELSYTPQPSCFALKILQDN